VNRYNGPALAKWLLDQPEADQLTPQRRRTVRKWAEGSDPIEQHVDATLCSVGIHLREVPASAVTGWPEVSVQGLEIEWDSRGRRYLRRAA
jgi:hypothetical protein